MNSLIQNTYRSRLLHAEGVAGAARASWIEGTPPAAEQRVTARRSRDLKGVFARRAAVTLRLLLCGGEEEQAADKPQACEACAMVGIGSGRKLLCSEELCVAGGVMGSRPWTELETVTE